MSEFRRIEQVAVVGAGFMGSGIAESVAVAGLPVVLSDVDQASIERARGSVEESLERAVQAESSTRLMRTSRANGSS